MENGRARPFWAAFFLTILLIATIMGMVTVDYRCRMMTTSADGAAEFYWDSAADGEGLLGLHWFGTERVLTLRPGEKLKEIFGEMPVLIPRILRAAALLSPPETEKTEDTPPSFLFEYLRDIPGAEKAHIGADQPGQCDIIDKKDHVEQ